MSTFSVFSFPRKAFFIAACLFVFGFQSAAAAEFEEGMGSYKKKDYAAALREWRPLAEKGDAKAQYNVGVLYAQGHGVKADRKEAIKWFRLAAEQKHTEAELSLGILYAEGEGVKQDAKEAVKWFRLAAAAGNADAQNSLGTCYANGEGLAIDRVAAHALFSLAASNNKNSTAAANRTQVAKLMNKAEIKSAQDLKEAMEKPAGLLKALDEKKR